jgi:hypothetical protein
VLAYLIFQGRGMAERNVQRAEQARDELRRVVGFSAADELEKLDRLKKLERLAKPNLRDCARGLCSNETGKDAGDCCNLT